MKQFTGASAPRQGGKPGRKVKLNAQAWKAIEMFVADFNKRGQKAINALYIEQPAAYVKLGLDLSAKIVLSDAAAEDTGPTLLVVKWGDPKSPPPPPPEIPSEPPATPRGPMQMPRLLSFERPLD